MATAGEKRLEASLSLSGSFGQVEAHVELTHGGKSSQISSKAPLVALQHTDN